MARILVAGGLMQQDEENSDASAARRLFAAEIGRQIVARGHVVLGGCRTSLDAEVAMAAEKEAISMKKTTKQVVRSWVTKSTTPSHSVGEIIRSKMVDWGRVPRGLAFPEPVQEADVVIIIGGWDGTHYAASWARLANKPLVPVAAFGLAAAEIYEDEMRSFERRYGARLSVDDFETLNRLLQNYDETSVREFAKDVISLAERTSALRETMALLATEIREGVGAALGEAHGTADRLAEATASAKPDVGWLRDAATEANDKLAATTAAIASSSSAARTSFAVISRA